ncbi:MAG: hypothetical protein JNL70_24855 [Saprospiraceae bacterium]|nr:hypothetical protein [Saprospiraceae bacterium]
MNNNATLVTKFVFIFLLVVHFSEVAQAQTYCKPLYSNSCGSSGHLGVYISNFELKKGTVAVINQSSSCSTTVNGGSFENHTLYSSTYPSVYSGTSYNFALSIAKADASTNPMAGYALFFDKDDNGDFTGSGELLSTGTIVASGSDISLQYRAASPCQTPQTRLLDCGL